MRKKRPPVSAAIMLSDSRPGTLRWMSPAASWFRSASVARPVTSMVWTTASAADSARRGGQRLVARARVAVPAELVHLPQAAQRHRLRGLALLLAALSGQHARVEAGGEVDDLLASLHAPQPLREALQAADHVLHVGAVGLLVRHPQAASHHDGVGDLGFAYLVAAAAAALPGHVGEGAEVDGQAERIGDAAQRGHAERLDRVREQQRGPR